MKTTPTILILISIGLFYMAINPQFKEVKIVSATVSEYKNVLDNVSTISNIRDELLLTYESIPSEELERIYKITPDQVDTVRIALDLDTMAATHGISIKGVSIVSENQAGASTISKSSRGTYETIPVSFSFVSDYENFVAFLTDLETSLRMMDVRSILFQTTETGIYEHRMLVEAYSLK